MKTELEHDVVGWFEGVNKAKSEHGLKDWPDFAPRLSKFGAGTLTVDDPANTCERKLGATRVSPTGRTWELVSPLRRPVFDQT